MCCYAILMALLLHIQDSPNKISVMRMTILRSQLVFLSSSILMFGSRNRPQSVPSTLFPIHHQYCSVHFSFKNIQWMQWTLEQKNQVNTQNGYRNNKENKKSLEWSREGLEIYGQCPNIMEWPGQVRSLEN